MTKKSHSILSNNSINLKIILLIFSFGVFLFSCQEEEILNLEEKSEVLENINLNYTTDFLTGNDVPDIVDELIFKTGADAAKSKFNQKIGLQNASIHTYEVKKVTTKGKGATYTFDIEVESAPENHIYNLVVQKKNGKIIGMQVILFELKPETVEEFFTSNDDLSKLDANIRTFTFSSFLEDSKLNKIGENGDCPNGVIYGSSSSGDYGFTPPGGTFIFQPPGLSISTSFGSLNIPSYYYTVTTNYNGVTSSATTGASSNPSSINTVSTTSSSISTSPINISASSSWLQGLVSLSMSLNPMNGGGGGGGSNCDLYVVVNGPDGTTNWVYVPCPSGGGNSQKSSISARTSTCTVIDAGMTISTASKSVNKLNYYLEKSLTSYEIDWLNNPSPFPSNTAYGVVQALLINGFTNPENLNHTRKIILSGADGNLASTLPLVQYPKDKAAEYKNKYKKLTKYLREELPKISDNNTIVNKINELTDAPIDKIKQALSWGKGPEIIISQLGGEGIYEKYGAYRGHLSSGDMNKIYLDIDLVEDMENNTLSQEQSEALAFLVAVTILHEYNHLGDHIFGNEFWSELYIDDPIDLNEVGLIFEESIFGQHVWRTNAGLVLRNFGGW